ncbi:hypothetical protein, partial [Azospirillum sp. B4]|uniref:hypothetical protein n=1 Tax=Azospirillum sp. B4 TaxID=95605 RepID=UPI0011DE1A41
MEDGTNPLPTFHHEVASVLLRRNAAGADAGAISSVTGALAAGLLKRAVAGGHLFPPTPERWSKDAAALDAVVVVWEHLEGLARGRQDSLILDPKTRGAASLISELSGADADRLIADAIRMVTSGPRSEAAVRTAAAEAVAPALALAASLPQVGSLVLALESAGSAVDVETTALAFLRVATSPAFCDLPSAQRARELLAAAPLPEPPNGMATRKAYALARGSFVKATIGLPRFEIELVSRTRDGDGTWRALLKTRDGEEARSGYGDLDEMAEALDKEFGERLKPWRAYSLFKLPDLDRRNAGAPPS